MSLNFRFAVASDLHIALPQTTWSHPRHFHLVEFSIPALEIVLEHLTQLEIDFLLLPGDLTQHGEPDNHAWLQQRLAELPFPVYVVPGNHDIPVLLADGRSISAEDFPHYYHQFGYHNLKQLDYTCQLLPGVRLIGLNSNQFDQEGQQCGRLAEPQLDWLREVLRQAKHELVLVMVHHNVVEHLPNQLNHPLGRRYMLENPSALLAILQEFGVQLVFTGHLHVQDIADWEGIYDITTGSLVSYPHPYRILEFRQDSWGRNWLQVESHRVKSVPHAPHLQELSRAWLADHSLPFMVKLLTSPPLNLPQPEAEELASSLRYLWADVAAGDAQFDFPDFPPDARHYLQKFSAVRPDGTPAFIDNHTTLLL